MKEPHIWVQLADIPPEGLRLEWEHDPVALDLEREDLHLRRPVAVQCNLVAYGGRVGMTGEVSADLQLTCSRCLEPFSQTLVSPLEVSFVPKGAQRLEEAVELEEDELDLYVYTEEQIDLFPAVRDQIALCVPFAPLCGPACQGLCPHCGQNRNHFSCRCAEEETGDARLEVLKDLDFRNDNVR